MLDIEHVAENFIELTEKKDHTTLAIEANTAIERVVKDAGNIFVPPATRDAMNDDFNRRTTQDLEYTLNTAINNLTTITAPSTLNLLHYLRIVRVIATILETRSGGEVDDLDEHEEEAVSAPCSTNREDKELAMSLIVDLTHIDGVGEVRDLVGRADVTIGEVILFPDNLINFLGYFHN